MRLGDSWPVQRRAYEHLSKRPFAMLDMGMGTGKSKVLVDHVVNADLRRVLIVCPKSVTGVWVREFQRWAGWSRKDGVVVADGGSLFDRAALAEGCWGMRDRLVLVANYESLRMKPDKTCDPLCAWALTKPWDLVVADESHRIKDPHGQASFGVYQIGRRAKRRVAMTGTLVPHDPIDLWAQYRFVDVEILGASVREFCRYFAVTHEEQVVAWRDLSGLGAILRPHTFTATLAETDVVLPPVSHVERYVRLTGDSAARYDEVAAATPTEGDRTCAMVRLLRLRQATSGIFATHGVRELADTTKIEAAEDLIADADGPVVVFCAWRGEVDAVARIARRRGLRYGEISGRRKDLTANATMPHDIDVMAVQLQSGAVGIDLTRARHAVYLAHPWSPGEYEQSLARIHRPGQTRPVVCWHLLAEGTVDEAVWDALRDRQSVVDSVLAELRAGSGAGGVRGGHAADRCRHRATNLA